MTDHGLGRLPHFDERSRAFGIVAIEARPPRSYTWYCAPTLDQGDQPECVGFSWSHELGARPVVIPVSNDRGRTLYRDAQAVDRAEGRHWDEGASILAGAKAVRASGLMESYRWAFSVGELATGVSWTGPAVIGVNWYAGMMNPDSNDLIRPTGSVVGGHAILVRGYSIKTRRFLLRNSWGPDWGRGGDCLIYEDHLAGLLAEQGEACIPVRRRKV